MPPGTFRLSSPAGLVSSTTLTWIARLAAHGQPYELSIQAVAFPASPPKDILMSGARVSLLVEELL